MKKRWAAGEGVGLRWGLPAAPFRSLGAKRGGGPLNSAHKCFKGFRQPGHLDALGRIESGHGRLPDFQDALLQEFQMGHRRRRLLLPESFPPWQIERACL